MVLVAPSQELATEDVPSLRFRTLGKLAVAEVTYGRW